MFGQLVSLVSVDFSSDPLFDIHRQISSNHILFIYCFMTSIPSTPLFGPTLVTAHIQLPGL